MDENHPMNEDQAAILPNYGETGQTFVQAPPYFVGQATPAPKWDTVLGSDKPLAPPRGG
jgi:hypothetical protein